MRSVDVATPHFLQLFSLLVTLLLLPLVFCVVHANPDPEPWSPTDAAEEPAKDDRHLAIVEPLVLVSTLDGTLHAIEKKSGNIRWSRKEEPVLKVPADVTKRTSFLPDPKDGSLYIYGFGEGSGEDAIKKLPFTIPELVSASPCRSTDGVLYTGQKLDVWFAIDFFTGDKLETISFHGSDKICPVSYEKAIFVGRTEFQIAMYDSKTGEKRWNASFFDYAAQTPPDLAKEYGELHSPSPLRRPDEGLCRCSHPSLTQLCTPPIPIFHFLRLYFSIRLPWDNGHDGSRRSVPICTLQRISLEQRQLLQMPQ